VTASCRSHSRRYPSKFCSPGAARRGAATFFCAMEDFSIHLAVRLRRPLAPRPGSLLIFAHPSSIFLWDESPVRDRGHVVVSLFLGSLRQLNGFPRHFLVGNQVEQMSNEVQTRAPLIVGAHNMPRCILGIRGFQHLISSVGICIPFAARRQVHRAKFPLPQRILDARLKALLLLLIANF
jgi:hypothetical protein